MVRPRLAVHRTILVVDVEGFGDQRRTNAHQVAVRAGLYDVLRRAFHRAHIPWSSCRREDRGDGVFVLVDAAVPKLLFCESLPHALVEALREHNRPRPEEERIRLRVAIHAGEVNYDDHGVTSTAVNQTFRLLDAPPLKAALAASPGVLALIASSWFFDEVIRHSATIDLATYQPFRVVVKETATLAWICLPDHPDPRAGIVLPAAEVALPGEDPYFTGREKPMEHLRDQIDRQSRPGVVTIHAIDGMAGVGKTTFARHAARALAPHYPDGVIWVDLYGYVAGFPPREPAAALEQLLLQLGVSPKSIKPGSSERLDQWRHHLRHRRLIIVLDNAATSEQVLPLLPDTAGSVVLITSRRKLTALTDAQPLSLDVLEWDEAERLFVGLVGEQRCGDREAVRRILAACGRLPLAIRLIAGRLRHHPGELLPEVASELADQTEALDAFAAEHVSVRATFEWSYRLLTEEQRKVFRLLGCHPGSEISAVAVAALNDLPVTRVKRLLRELAEHNLLDDQAATDVLGGPRYRMHDLMRLYARERVEESDDRSAAMNRLVARYLEIVREADRLLRNEVDGTESWLTPADPAQARHWLTTERHNLVECVRVAYPTPDAAALAGLSAVHYRDFGFWSDARYLYEQALVLQRRLGGRHGELEALRGLGDVAWLVGDYDQARYHHSRTLELARALGDRFTEVEALCGLGEVARLLDDYDQAREHHSRALDLAVRLGDQRGELRARRALGEVERAVGEYGRSRDYHSRALELARRLGYRQGEAEALWGLGDVERFAGDYALAHTHHSQALVLTRQLGYRRGEVLALRGLGEVERSSGNYELAQEHHTEAIALAREIGYRSGEAEALRGLADTEVHMGDYARARAHFTDALNLGRQYGYRQDEAEALSGLGAVERLTGNHDRARDHYVAALSVSRQFGLRPAEVVALCGLGAVELRAGALDQARTSYSQGLSLAERLGDRLGQTTALLGLGDVECSTANHHRARKHYEQALIVARRLGDRLAAAQAQSAVRKSL